MYSQESPPYDAIAYQYLIAGNGVFIRTETRFFDALIPLSASIIRGLAPLKLQFRLKVPRLPAQLQTAVPSPAARYSQTLTPGGRIATV